MRVKTVEQQTICSLHRVRAALMKMRIARLNAARRLLREFGVTMAEGAGNVAPAVREALSESPSPVPEPLHKALLSIMAEAGELEDRSGQVEKQLKALSGTVPFKPHIDIPNAPKIVPA